VDASLNKNVVRAELYTAELASAESYTAEGFDERVFGVCGIGEEREIEIFGEPIRFEETLLYTGTTFEDPVVRSLWIECDRRQEPAENVVLLNDLGAQLPFASA